MEIQRATLRLAGEHGFDMVTTEAISRLAGISPRTFFNYYTNKEAAAVGQPEGFSRNALENFETGAGSVAEDLRKLLLDHLETLIREPDILIAVGRVSRADPAVKWRLDRIVATFIDDLAQSLAKRLPDALEAVVRAIAEWSLTCTRGAIDCWISDRTAPVSAALDTAWTTRLSAARIVLGD